ncbi:hypothetical protein ETD86_29980 [Nonomuraea turkmeniaca]|uniref:Helix-turn-helix domain-containing protein n=1 Tax=Nonomuraea turkmeniaca TaxID=103838 RepID=A0A5S4F9T1_9ACTN|nr:hypothetical protein [Nonomuraea turkmeniaca]TMR13797.1 hypothetical protein ETD86_29980 [Nonomuraea turkmeniaca]
MSSGMRHRRRPGRFVPRTTIRDTGIDYTALGLLVHLLDKPRGWRVRGDNLAAERSNSNGQVMKSLAQLRAAGYYRLERRRLLNGKFVMGTAISEEPVEEWAADNAEFGGEPVPLVQQPDGTFLVRHKNGQLTDDGFGDWEDFGDDDVPDDDPEEADFPDLETEVPDFPEPETEAPVPPDLEIAGPGHPGAANVGPFGRREKKQREGKGFLPAVGELPVGEGAPESAVPAGNEDHHPSVRPAPAAVPGLPGPPTLTVFRALPADVRRRIGRNRQGIVLGAIAREIGQANGRTVAELVARVERRWDGWQALNPHGRIGDPVAVAVSLVQRRHCANVRCEDGIDLDSGARCPACAGRGPRPPSPPGGAAFAQGGNVHGGSVVHLHPRAPARSMVSTARDSSTPAPTAPPVAEVLAFRPPRELEPVAPDFRPARRDPERPAKAAAIQAARAALRPSAASDRERELDDALKIPCPVRLCGADEGALCVNRDGVEMPKRHLHGPRVVQARELRLAGASGDARDADDGDGGGGGDGEHGLDVTG